MLPCARRTRASSLTPTKQGRLTGCTVDSLISRKMLRWKGLYRGRASVERTFGRLKNEWALTPLRVRRIERVRLHADLTILAKLSCALARPRAVPLAA
jgi:transposase